jgi:hypothetical protein
MATQEPGKPAANSPVQHTTTPAGTRQRRVYRIGRDEFRTVAPVAIFATLFALLVYGIVMYESVFQLPLLANTK